MMEALHPFLRWKPWLTGRFLSLVCSLSSVCVEPQWRVRDCFLYLHWWSGFHGTGMWPIWWFFPCICNRTWVYQGDLHSAQFIMVINLSLNFSSELSSMLGSLLTSSYFILMKFLWNRYQHWTVKLELRTVITCLALNFCLHFSRACAEVTPFILIFLTSSYCWLH